MENAYTTNCDLGVKGLDSFWFQWKRQMESNLNNWVKLGYLILSDKVIGHAGFKLFVYIFINRKAYIKALEYVVEYIQSQNNAQNTNHSNCFKCLLFIFKEVCLLQFRSHTYKYVLFRWVQLYTFKAAAMFLNKLAKTTSLFCPLNNNSVGQSE